MIMIGSVVYVSTLDAPVNREEAIDADLRQAAIDFLNTANDEPLPPSACGGSTNLEQLVIDGFRGNDKAWDARRDLFFAKGVDADMYLDNGYGLYPLHARGDFMGTTADVTVQPNFSYVFHTPQYDPLTGTENFRSREATIMHSKLARISGDAGLTTVLSSNAAGITMEVSAAFPIAVNRSSTGVSALDWLDYQGSPRSILGASAGSASTLYLRARPGPSNVIPAGSTVRLSLFPGWRAEPTAAAGWRVDVANGEPSFVATDDLVGSHVMKVEVVAPSTPLHPFDVIRAQAYNSSFAHADLVVQYQVSTDSTLPRQLYLTTPYPVFRGQDADFAVTLANGAENVTARNVTIAIPGGYDAAHNGSRGAELFNDTVWDAGAGAWVPRTIDSGDGGVWTVWDKRHASWSGVREVAPFEAQAWSVSLPITDAPEVVTSVDATFHALPGVNVTFPNGFSEGATQWGAVPGLVSLDVPNETVDALAAPPRGNADGYPHDAGATSGAFTLRSTASRAPPALSGSYGLAAADPHAAQTESSLANSTFGVSSHVARLGTDVTLSGDVQSLVSSLPPEALGSARLGLDLYAPPSLGCAPTASFAWNVNTLPAPQVNDLAVWHAGGAAGDIVFVASNDSTVYEVLPGGAPGWKLQPPAAPARLALDAVAGREVLFVADQGGALSAYDAADATPLWTTRIGTGAPQPPLPNATTGVLLAAAGPTIARLDEATGAILAAGASAAPLLDQIALGPDGGAFALSTDPTRGISTLERLDASLVARASARVDGAGFAVGSAGVLSLGAVGSGSSLGSLAVTLLDPQTLAPLPPTGAEVPLPWRAVAGDATGDGVPDLVVAANDGQLDAIDGATGREAWRLETNALRGSLLGEGPLSGQYGGGSGGLPWPTECVVGFRAFSVSESQATGCVGMQVDELAFQPLLTVAARGHTLYVVGSESSNQAIALLLDAHGNVSWRKGTTSGFVTTAGLLDAYAGTEATLLGVQDGTVDAYADTPDAATLLAAHPSSAVGSFVFPLHVPAGAAFGTHLVTATLTWQDAGGTPHRAQMLDWFDVVDPQGNPVDEPFYRVALVLADRAHAG
ncbi:MAG: hypothetical protein QOE90_3526 [Thermoplasmata archaeon]|jgi:hypothetical protein|nr:hypothetical protein [Thermoplasmata archaeon]